MAKKRFRLITTVDTESPELIRPVLRHYLPTDVLRAWSGKEFQIEADWKVKMRKRRIGSYCPNSAGWNRELDKGRSGHRIEQQSGS